jgi:hypothetical protein
MKKLYSFIISLLIIIAGNSQTFEWVKTAQIDYEFNPGMIQYTTNSDSEGNIYFFGMQEHLLFYNQAMGTLFLKKYNPAGELIWEKTITGEGLATGIYCDENGGIFLYGEFHSDINFWNDLTLYFEGINTNSFLVKIKGNGEVDWGLNLEELPMESGVVSDVTSDNSGMLYVGYSTWINSHILKIDADGAYTSSVIQDDVSLISGVDVDGEGNIYATGGCAGSNSSFGGVIYPAPFTYSMYIVKYNSDGEPQWVKFIEDITCSTLRLKCDQTGGIYVAGAIFAESMLDTIVINGATWVYDFFLTRLNTDGEFQWALECPEVLTGDATVGQLQFLNTDAEGNALLAGFTRGMIDWGNGNISNVGGFYYNVMMWNVSSQGVINWIKTAGSQNYDNSHSICAGQDGDVYLAGITGGNSTFDTINIITEDFVYPFLAKLDLPSLTQVTVNEEQLSVTVFPNPATDIIFIDAKSGESFMIFNSNGEKLKEGRFNTNSYQINVSDLSSGIYFLIIQNEVTTQSRNAKFIVR